MSRVFISDRRDDAAGYAGRLEEALEKRLGRGSVFRDVLDIPPGDDFVAAIRQRLAQSDTVLVPIGPRWAGEGGSEPRRSDDPQDFVRLEVAAALESGVRVVPVLLPGATMSAESALPDELRALARRNAITLADPSWSADVRRLVSAIGSPPPRARWPWVAGAAALALCAGVGDAVEAARPERGGRSGIGHREGGAATPAAMLRPRGGPVLHGDGGLSRKGPAPGQASWYASIVDLETTGTVRTGSGGEVAVRGASWFAHEFGSGQLAEDRAG